MLLAPAERHPSESAGMLRWMLQLLLMCSAAAFSAGVTCRHGVAARAPIAMQEERRFEVCQGRYCTKKGAKRTLALFEELAAGAPGVLVEAADMGHTDHGCFDECPMGRESRLFRTAVSFIELVPSSPRFAAANVRVGGNGARTDGGKIINGIKGAAKVAELLGVDPPTEA